MTGYAPNPMPSSNEPASLHAGLLARKGEATPAVDADAHAGVDVDMHAMRPAPRGIAQNTIKTLYEGGPSGDDTVRSFHPRPANLNVRREDPLPSPGSNISAMAQARLSRRLKQGPEHETGMKATVTFRMPAKEFVRLRFASRDLDMFCQSIILDAIDVYLDANDIAPVSDEACARETERLLALAKKRRAEGRE